MKCYIVYTSFNHYDYPKDWEDMDEYYLEFDNLKDASDKMVEIEESNPEWTGHCIDAEQFIDITGPLIHIDDIINVADIIDMADLEYYVLSKLTWEYYDDIHIREGYSKFKSIDKAYHEMTQLKQDTFYKTHEIIGPLININSIKQYKKDSEITQINI